ncbi:hypothetical protein SNE40_009839 [Patella caerulea]|uniref:Uncharacterized protein n=1 Tax=Patella caerulea TaxID=87958 RepID=A0AAN8JUU6_PATCE
MSSSASSKKSKRQTNGIKLATVSSWIQKYDKNKTWLDYELETAGIVNKISCKLCTKYENKINGSRNFNRAFIVGTTGSALKADNLRKHIISDPHIKAVQYENKIGIPAIDIIRKAPIFQSFSGAEEETRERVSKLFDIAYTCKRGNFIF